MINNIQPDTIVKDKFDNAMYNFCKKLTHNSHQYYIKSDMDYRPVYKSAGGRKFIRVKSFETAKSRRNSQWEDKGRIHCFVNSENGDIYKPASWKAPHLNGDCVRGNIFDSTTFENTDPHGGWLYHNSTYNQGFANGHQPLGSK